MMNTFLSQKTNMKSLQYGPEKCHQMHVGKQKRKCPELYIDQWKLVKKDELETGVENQVDALSDEHKVEMVDDEKYLGTIISFDGKNTKNIDAPTLRLAMGELKRMLRKLEQCDEQLLRTILECPFSTPKEMLYLELGVTH